MLRATAAAALRADICGNCKSKRQQERSNNNGSISGVKSTQSLGPVQKFLQWPSALGEMACVSCGLVAQSP